MRSDAFTRTVLSEECADEVPLGATILCKTNSESCELRKDGAEGQN